ncbi:Wzz/FepE/Etk N-terminal domain-containing protein, partial [Allopontixanthobacter sp.]|uniref:Wzz/FepE/Etk N-terminal domain-containing protein n=1 Tax=Allopontixanthobacter sp. TaxID=2906452 RepID=UPI002ABB1A61
MNTLATQVPRAQIHTTTRRKTAGNSVSMSKTWAMAYRQRWVLLGFILGALLIGLLITLLTEPKYTAQASVQLEQQSATVIPEGGLEPEIPVQESERFLQTQLDRILSRNTAERVAERLKISANPGLLAALGFEDGGANATSDDIVLRLQENVTAALGLNTRLAQITFTSYD